jgi:hypothetical protein
VDTRTDRLVVASLLGAADRASRGGRAVFGERQGRRLDSPSPSRDARYPTLPLAVPVPFAAKRLVPNLC